jgi:hypothetical protein
MSRTVLSVIALLACGTPALAGQPWTTWENAKEAARSSGRPILVWSTVGPGGACECCERFPDQNRAMEDPRVTRRSDEYEWVRCTDKRTAQAVKVQAPPELIAFDCDGEKIAHYAVSDVASIEKALADVETRYTDRPVVWGDALDAASLDKAREAKKLVVALFVDDHRDSVATAKELDDRRIVKHHGRIVFVRLPFVADSPEAKRWGAAGAPTLVLIDPGATETSKQALGRVGGRRKSPELRSLILDGFEKLKAAQRSR